MLDHALMYARAGMPVIPLHSVLSDGSCTCGKAKCHSPGKHPRTANGLKDATTESRKIKKWWAPSRWPNASIGGVGGRYLCLDIDAKRGGFASLTRLIEANTALPETAIAESGLHDGERGKHYWFLVPDDHETPGSRQAVRTGIDIRCAGGYAVLPPSQHASGVNYEWITPFREIADAPTWVLDLVPEFITGDATWEPSPNFQMSKPVKEFLRGDLEIEVGEQRDFLVAAARSVLTEGHSVERTTQLLWEGYEGEGGILASAWDEDDPWTPEDIYALVSDIYRRPPNTPLQRDFTREDFTFDDAGNARRLIASYKPGHVFHVPELDRWYVWDDRLKCFQPTPESTLRSRWTKITEELSSLARQAHDEATEKALRTHARNSRMRPRVEAAVVMARDRAIKHESQLDVDPFLFAAANGVIDLRTGDLSPNAPEALITRRSPVEYEPDAQSSLFDEYLEASVPDAALRDYLQLVCGYSLTGSTDEDAFFYLYGRPGSGKSTFTEALSYVMGSYAMSADTSSFMRDSRRGGSAPTEDLARLVGARLVTTGEVEQNERLASALVSRITGGDPIAARMLYGRTFEYLPRFKLWIAANHLPRVASARSGIWRRVKILQFDQVVPRERIDPLFRTHRIKEPEVAAAILAWMVDGAIMWRRRHAQGHPLREPSIVTEEVERYQREADHVNGFAADALRHSNDDNDRVSTSTMFEHYLKWCDNEGRERRETQRGLALKLGDLGFVARPARLDGRVQRCWLRVQLVPQGGVHLKRKR